MLSHGIPTHDIFTYTASAFPWVNHEWGSDVLLAMLYQLGGYGLLIGVYAAIWTAALFMRNSRSSLVAMLLVATALIPYAGVREFAWTLLCFTICLRILESKHPQTAYLIIPLTLLWANLHGGFIMSFALTGYFMLRKRSWRLALILIASILVTFINPYGVHLYEEIFRTLGDSQLHRRIQEWYIMSFELPSMIVVSCWIAAFILLYKQWWRRLLDLGPILLAGAISASRNLPFLAIYIMPDFDKIHQYVLSHIPGTRQRLRKRATIILASIGCSIVVICTLFASFTAANSKTEYPQSTLAYLRAHPCQGNLFAHYNYGGYLIWQLPGVKLFIDGRMPSWRDEQGVSYYDRHQAIFYDPAARKREFSTYNIRCVLIPREGIGTKLASDLKKEGWRRVSTDTGTQLLIAPLQAK